jgi:hypothetical protein
MAKIFDLENYNSIRKLNDNRLNKIDGDLTSIGKNVSSFLPNTLNFENKNGDNIVITPMELKEYLSEFLTKEINLYADETVKQYREQLERRLDVQISNLEGHINDKIIKMTQDIISTTTSRLINEEVNRRVNEKLRKIRKAIDDSI